MTCMLAIDGLMLNAAGQPIVDDVSITIALGEIAGLVGESGSGKSQTALAIAGLTPPGIQRTGGQIRLDGACLSALTEQELRAVRGRDIAFVFQEPMTALNPTMRVGRQMVHILSAACGLSAQDAEARARLLLDQVALKDVDRVMAAYPHQLSGGMRQRVLIALAFGCEPKLVIADEPTTALDVIVQAQILFLFRALAKSTGCSVLFISHDLAVVRQLCSKVYVMKDGKIVESGPTLALLQNPAEDYTRALIASAAEGVAA